MNDTLLKTLEDIANTILAVEQGLQFVEERINSSDMEEAKTWGIIKSFRKALHDPTEKLWDIINS